MVSFKNALQNAVDKKRMPHFKPGSMRDLGLNLRLPVPVSLSNVIKGLDNLNPAGVIYKSGPMTANFVHGSAQLYLQSDGLVSFSGNVHESGVVGDNYLFMMALLDVRDLSGNTLVFAHNSSVSGQLDVGSSDASWQTNGPTQVVKDQWDNVKRSRVQSHLHVSTDPVQVFETAYLGIWIAAGLALTGIFFGGFASDPRTKCDPTTNPDSKGGFGLDMT